MIDNMNRQKIRAAIQAPNSDPDLCKLLEEVCTQVNALDVRVDKYLADLKQEMEYRSKAQSAPELLTAGQMARLAHVKVSWLREECDAGRIPHLRAGDRYLFDEISVLTCLSKKASGAA